MRPPCVMWIGSRVVHLDGGETRCGAITRGCFGGGWFSGVNEGGDMDWMSMGGRLSKLLWQMQAQRGIGLSGGWDRNRGSNKIRGSGKKDIT